MSESVSNVIDLDRKANQRLPQELKHERVVGHRYTGIPGFSRAYQVTFDQTWVPFDYLRASDPGTEKWEIIHACVDYPDLKLLGVRLPYLGSPQLTITVKERARNGAKSAPGDNDG